MQHPMLLGGASFSGCSARPELAARSTVSFCRSTRSNENVNGLTHRSVTVRPVDPEGTAPPQPVLAGRLTCTTRSGRVTSCTTGHVREATFEPSVRLRPNQYYLVELNPEHSLGVTDLAGNPFDRDGILVTTRR